MIILGSFISDSGLQPLKFSLELVPLMFTVPIPLLQRKPKLRLISTPPEYGTKNGALLKKERVRIQRLRRVMKFQKTTT